VNHIGDSCLEGEYVVGFSVDGFILCAPFVRTYNIGDTGPGGGIVFYVTNGGLHGLEAAPTDSFFLDGSGIRRHSNFRLLSPSPCVGNGGTDIPGADGTAFGTSLQNITDMINAGCLTAETYAETLAPYSPDDGWYLPALDEMVEVSRSLSASRLGGWLDVSTGDFLSTPTGSSRTLYATSSEYDAIQWLAVTVLDDCGFPPPEYAPPACLTSKRNIPLTGVRAIREF
jgi:hypothetical protein